MALANLSDSPPNMFSAPGGPARAASAASIVPVVNDGLAARASSLIAALGSLVGDLDPGLLSGRDAAFLYEDLAHLERLAAAGKTLLAPRIAESGHWKLEGHRSPASLLATLEGGTAGQARQTLETGQRLAGLPGVEAALRKGTLSGPKAVEITSAATLEPSAESDLLAGSADQPLHVIKERCARVKATSAAQDPMATMAKIHNERTFTWWTDPEGAFCYRGRDTAARGARLMAHLTSTATRLGNDRRAAAKAAAEAAAATAANGDSTGAAGATGATGAHSPPPESQTALQADAFYLLVTGRRPGPPNSSSTSGTKRDSGRGNNDRSGSEVDASPDSDTDTDSGIDADAEFDVDTVLTEPDDPIKAPPPVTVMVRVDLAALRRGTALPGELSEIDGHGPVPIPVIKHLMDDSFLALVFVEAGDIKAISHQGRTINAALRTALAFRDKCCVVPGCGVAYSLEVDHVIKFADRGPTELLNLARICHHHHFLKTYNGWELARHGPTDEDPQWSFTPQPAFGQEPGLGIDKPPEPVPRV